MLYEQKSISPIFFMSNVLEYYVNNPPGFDENEIDKKEGEIFTDVYYPQDPNILEGRYKVSNMGRVYDTYNKSFLTNYSDKGGYEYVNLASVNSNNKVEIYRYRLNRIVLSSFDPNDNMCNLHVHHINNISCDNRVENLDWATPKENSNYAKQDGRFSLISDESKITINLADNICNYIKNGHTPEEAGVKYNVNDKIVYRIVSGEFMPFMCVKHNLPKIENKYKTKYVAKPITDDMAKLVKSDIVNGIAEADIMRKYKLPRHVVSDIRHGRTFQNIDVGHNLPEIRRVNVMTPEKADEIGKLFAEGKLLKEVSEISGFVNHNLLKIKRGDIYPEVKQKYNLDDVKEYNDQLSDEVILSQVIPEMLSRKYESDRDIAEIFGCSSAQIRDLRLHRRRQYLTDGVDFENCYVKSGKQNRRTDEEIKQICEFIQDHPKMSYHEILKSLSSSIPRLTYKLLQDIKLRKTHRDISGFYVW